MAQAMSGRIVTSARVCIVAPDRRFAWILSLALRAEAWRLRIQHREIIRLSSASRRTADVIVYAFDPASFDRPSFADEQLAQINRDPAKVKIVMQLIAPTIHGPLRAEIDRKNRLIETLARRSGAHIVATADIMQSGAQKRLTKSGKPNFLGYGSLAHVVLRAIKVNVIRSTLTRRPRASKQAIVAGQPQQPGAIPDVDEVMSAMSWNSPSLPANLEGSYSAEVIADFAANVVFFPSFSGWGKFPLADPIDWGMAGANWSWQSYFTGLEFVRPALALWYDVAAGQESKTITDALVSARARGKMPHDLLQRASFLVADFVRNNPPTAPKNQRAYFQGTICRRVKALLTLLVCAKKADELGIPLPRDEVEAAFHGLADSLEMLKSDEIYPVAGNHGVRQDVLFIVAGLLWHQLPYGRELLDLGMTRLQKHQLDRALSPDGVWLENSFGYHGLIMNQFTMTAADLRTAGAPGVEILHDALARMSVFIEAMIRCDGYGPLIGDSAPKRYFGQMAEVAAELTTGNPDSSRRSRRDAKTPRRARDTYIFPKSGYFASHSNREMDPNGSSMILFANLSRPKHKQADDLSVLFTHGTADLLIDGGTYNKEISDTVRNAARYDPGTHNTYRINGAGYPVRAVKGAKPAGVTEMWEGNGWAAARAFNNAYTDGRVTRFAIHLKRHHAVIVIDQLSAKKTEPALFEQFWHIAPDFRPAAQPSHHSGPWIFNSVENGTLIAAFDEAEATCAVEFGGPDNPIAWQMQPDGTTVPTPYLRRARTIKDGAMASLFQWSASAGSVEISRTERAKGETEIEARGTNFFCRFAAGENGVECFELRDADQRE